MSLGLSSKTALSCVPEHMATEAGSSKARPANLHWGNIFRLQQITVSSLQGAMACVMLWQAQALHCSRLVEPKGSVQGAAGEDSIVQGCPERALLTNKPAFSTHDSHLAWLSLFNPASVYTMQQQ